MKIISFKASNLLKLSAVQITPKGDLIILAGKNGAGKSAVLNGIAMVLGGAEQIAERPIRIGASKASGEVKLPGLTVTRTFTALGTALRIVNDEGVPQKSPQAILDAMIGNIAFDPLAFSRMKPAEQLETVRALVGLDFSKQKAQRQKLYDERTLVNRDLKNAEARLAATPLDPSAPAEPVQVGDLMAKLAKVDAANNAHAETRRLVSVFEKETADAETELEAAKKALAQAESKFTTLANQLANQRAAAISAVDTDTTPLKLAIQNAGAVNAKVAQNAAHAKIKIEVSTASQKSAKLSAEIDAIDNGITEAMGAAKFPLPGLAFTDDGVTLNNLPFSQASTAEKLRASVAMGMAMNPKLKVIFVRDGSLLDPDSLAMVAEMAEKNDYQIWMEDARSTDPAAVVIEDGHVQEPVAEAVKQPEGQLI